MNQENYTEAMINGETAFSNENYALALEWFRKALEENPDDLQALARAGTVCVPLDRYEESFKYFQRVMELNPENGDNAFNLGNAYFFHGDFGKALELYADAEMKGVSEEARPRLYYQMALLCSVRQDVKAALANFRKYEETDKTGMAATDPDVISEKVKLYMMADDFDNAEKQAVKWIGVAPTDVRSYMVYFSLLMARRNYAKAGEILDNAEKYAELDEDNAFALKLERITMLSAMADVDSAHAQEHLQAAYDLAEAVQKEAPAARQNEITLTIAEICMKMQKYDEAIGIAEKLLPGASAKAAAVEHQEVAYEELSDDEIEQMASEDMQMIEEKIEAGEIDESIGGNVDVEYDEDGNPVRVYPDGMFDEEPAPAPAAESAPQQAANAQTPPSGYYDRLNFVLLSCYAAVEDYQKARQTAAGMKFSENVYYSYFARYTEAFSMKKLAEAGAGVTKEAAEKQYAETIAFFRSRMLQGGNNNYAVIFRARMYAETGKFAKAEEMANLLQMGEKEAVMAYINDCKKELETN
ncbi:MAG: tetratricopeptide repeat protein [Oscillospiraceae bacterium]|nr:tetratricopeptide repeat protein [Oscillospiraceae bacterium]